MKRIFTTCFALFLALNLMAVNVWDGSSEPWTNGSGTETDPYLIETTANLAYLAQMVNEGYQAQDMAVFRYTYFMMTDDFDLNNINWTPIGNVNMNMEGYYFAGIFDGWYHNIDHLKIQSNADVCGLFGGLGGEIEGNMHSNGMIMHLSVTNGNVTSTGMGAAGIVGAMADDAMVIQCSFSGTISVSNNGDFCGAGGIAAAAAEKSSIMECSYHGSIIAANGNFMGAAGAGGIVGIALGAAYIGDCYNAGNITGNAMMLSVAAGIVGATLQENEVSIWNCYNVGTVNAITKGGIFGMISPINPTKNETSLEVLNCYYLNTCGGTTNYGVSKTFAEMQTEEFKDLMNSISYAFVMDNGTNNGYPIHALTGMMLWDATEITDHSAKLSANLHEGNDDFVRAVFVYQEYDVNGTNEPIEVEVEADDYVEVVLEDLEPNTSYVFRIYTECADGHLVDGGVLGGYCRSFTTEEYDAVAIQEAPEIQVYPNPATDVVHIQGVDASEIQIFNALGQLVKTVCGTNEINVSDLTAGTYLLRISTDSASLRKAPIIICIPLGMLYR